jgi:hypothetical protein
MSKRKYGLAEPFRSCSLEPRTGVTRNDNFVMALETIGSHIVRHLADLKRHAADIS